ncbi:hypothetical protein [Nitratireductor pacificus]|uniref:Uncharacterized protein n=1 Tax=Nitratireductor pacificus pht-3B TaxID=391937 RepID=K2M800_9HYPH|nr:hypothetical protein [Nitratireductor pacificus]EKF17085.1 hypothetical protein NA2_19983 [Nitratireductor pacificus pht-3B]
MSRPDYSPAMLAVFLRARAAFRVVDSGEPWRRTEIVRAFRAETRRLASVTNVEFHMAWMGLLQSPGPRAALWAVLGHFPADRGILLTHGGQEHG